MKTGRAWVLHRICGIPARQAVAKSYLGSNPVNCFVNPKRPHMAQVSPCFPVYDRHQIDFRGAIRDSVTCS
jgi:hypothetical protein